MAITTTRAHVYRALDFFKKNDIYFAIGKPTPWNKEDIPPVSNEDATDLEELIGFKKVEQMHLVVPDELGTIVYRDKKWSIVSPSEAIAKGAKWVYLGTTLRYDELPLGYYRQVGIFTGVVPYKGKAEVLKATVKATNVNTGNIVMNLGGSLLQIPVTPRDTATDIAKRIVESELHGWDIKTGGNETEVVFTCESIGKQGSPIFNTNNTGVSVDLTPVTVGENPVSYKFNLLPSEVANRGTLEVIDNRGASNRLEDQTEQFSIVIEF